MKKNKEIQNKIDLTFESANNIQNVDVPPFFKEKTLKRMFAVKENHDIYIFSWFSPKLQLATLACLVLLNVFAFIQINKKTYTENISSFATTYELETSYSQYSIFN